MKTLHYNCPAGISGDMNLGAMVDLGVDPQDLLSHLKMLPLTDWEISFARDQRQGVSGTRCDVTCPDEHHHRTFADIRRIIEEAPLPGPVIVDAVEVFRVLAEAEGKVHGKPPEAVHFHEVGAVDSIIDIVGAAICWHLLGVDRIALGTLELGGGTVQCAHGRMPVPAPATTRLVENMPVSMGGVPYEATTPTGAALMAGKQALSGQALHGRPVATGVGIGQKDSPAAANVLYVSLLEETVSPAGVDKPVLELAANLDDMPPEQVAFLAEMLLEAGALDVWQVPATFKKGRLGCVLHLLIRADDRDRMTGLLFRNSTTLGVRWKEWNRSVLERTIEEKQTPLGAVRVKTALLDGKPLRSKFEYEDLARLAREHDLSIQEIEQELRRQDV